MSILWLIAGLVIGWNLPQPQAAKDLQAKVVAWFRSFGQP